MVGEILIDFSSQPSADFMVIMAAELAQCLRRRDYDERFELIAHRPILEQAGGLGREAILFELMEVGVVDVTAAGPSRAIGASRLHTPREIAGLVVITRIAVDPLLRDLEIGRRGVALVAQEQHFPPVGDHHERIVRDLHRFLLMLFRGQRGEGSWGFASPLHARAPLAIGGRMHDIRSIRDNPDAFDAALARRGLAAQAAELVALDEKRRATITELQAGQARRNDASKAIGAAKARKDEALAQQLMTEVSALKDRLAVLEVEDRTLGEELNGRLASIPNLPLADVPDGADENENALVAERGTHPAFAFDAREHDMIGPPLGLDFEAGAQLSGARFTVVRGATARLHRALGQFMLDVLTRDHGYEEVIPPLLVRDEVAFGTGQLPKFAEDLFRTTDGRWLIPTAEVSLTNLVREQILPESALPMRLTALTPCFRSEAGAAGRDTRGFIRQHQFEKAEMVSITTADQSEAEHERMTGCAEDLLTRLGLAFRRMKLCTGDMGFSAARTYDLEVWLPGQRRYREISSCSTCTDFQARRMNARYRAEGEKGTRFVHTLNGSGLAVGRTLVAVLENYQQEDGAVAVPEVLQPYLRGLNRLEPKP